MRTFLGGLGIGTLIGMAIAPAAGRQTRQALKSRAKQLRQQAGLAGKRAGTRVDE
jgi:gas vesicle protein